MVCDLEVKRSRTGSAREIQAKEEGVEVEESSSKEEIWGGIRHWRRRRCESDVGKNGIVCWKQQVCGWTKGHARHIQTWWWNEEVRAGKNDWVKKSMDMTVEGSRDRGRPKMTWEKVVERDMKVRGLVRNDAKDGVKWRALSWGSKRLTPTRVAKMLQNVCC